MCFELQFFTFRVSMVGHPIIEEQNSTGRTEFDIIPIFLCPIVSSLEHSKPWEADYESVLNSSRGSYSIATGVRGGWDLRRRLDSKIEEFQKI